MRRRRVVGGLLAAAAALAAMAPADAQPRARLPRIGVLSMETPDRHPEIDAFIDGLRALGYVDGTTVEIAYRWANRDERALPRLAAELVALGVAVIVAIAPPAVRAAQAATTTIPIVMRTTVDPVIAGFTHSLARPDRNITGVSSASGALYPKRLELLRELVPGLRRVAILRNQTTPTANDYIVDVESAARTLHLDLQVFGIARPADVEAALAAAKRAGAQALMPLRDPTILTNRPLIVKFAVAYRLPALYDDREYVAAGGLASYGPDLAVLHHRAAHYVDRILKGAKPSDLPIEQPTMFELVINLGAARAIGFDVPQSLLLRADEVIE